MGTRKFQTAANSSRIPGREFSSTKKGPSRAAPNFGGGNRDRTGDLLHAMQALSQLSYTPTREGQLYGGASSAVKKAADSEVWPRALSSAGEDDPIACVGRDEAMATNTQRTNPVDDQHMEESIMKRLSQVFTLIALAVAWNTAAAQQPVKVGIVTFLSGPAAGPFGVPARNAAEVLVEGLNAGKVPGQYSTKGFGGAPLEVVLVDEAGPATKQVADYRNLVQRVDLVIGYVSSGNCLAIAPVAEELKKLTVLFDCGTPRIFEDASYKYVFRTHPTATMDSVGAALYVLDRDPKLK